jgi:hypothetical protein
MTPAEELALLVKKYLYFSDYAMMFVADRETGKSMLEKAEEILKEQATKKCGCVEAKK